MRRLAIAAFVMFVAMPAFAQNATLAQQKADAALRVLTIETARYSAGQATVDEVGTWAARWYQARRDSGLTGAALVAAAQEWVDKMKSFEQVVKSHVQSGLATTADSDKATFYRLEAEIALAKARTP